MAQMLSQFCQRHVLLQAASRHDHVPGLSWSDILHSKSVVLRFRLELSSSCAGSAARREFQGGHPTHFQPRRKLYPGMATSRCLSSYNGLGWLTHMSDRHNLVLGSSWAPIGDGMQQIWQMVLACCYLLITCGSMQSWLWHCIWHCEAGPVNRPQASTLLQASICCSHSIVMLLLCKGLSFPSIASRTHAIQPDFMALTSSINFGSKWLRSGFTECTTLQKMLLSCCMHRAGFVIAGGKAGQ